MALLTAVGTLALLCGVSGPASAASDVTATRGNAFGYWADDISFFGGVQADTGPTPMVTLASDASNTPQAASASQGTVAYGPATLFTSDGITVKTSGTLGTGGSVTSSSEISNINKSTSQPATTGSEIFAADKLKGSCTAPADSAPTGTTTMAPTSFTYPQRNNVGVVEEKTFSSPGGVLQIDSGWDDGDAIYPEPAASAEGLAEHDAVFQAVPANPAAGTKYAGHIHLSATSTDYYVVVFKERITNADGSLTVNPVHQYFGYKLDGNGNIVKDLPYSQGGSALHGHLYLGQVTCGVTTPTKVSVGDVALSEGNANTRTATLPVTLSKANTQTVTVNYATANGTATAPSDYAAKSGTLSIPAGAVKGTIAITVKGDTVDESDETFSVNLSSPVNATIGDGVGTVTIADDDPSSGLRVSVGDVTVDEGNSGTQTATFTVSLSAAAANTVTVNYATADGTAVQPSDYAAKSGTLTFNAGVVNQKIAVTVKSNTVVEPNETFTVNLSGVTGGATIADGSGTGTIRNDD